MRGLHKLILVTAAATAVALVVPPQAEGAATVSDPIAQGLVGPLQIDVGSDGQVYVAQDLIGSLVKISPNGTVKPLTSYPGEIAGVASRGYDVVFTGSDGGETTPPTITFLKRRFANGTVHTIANLLKFETTKNPDQVNTYGFKGLSKACKKALVPLEPEIGPATYKGILDSHPYSVANAPDGGWYVGEAAGNDILHVSTDGKISVVSVLAPVPFVVTADAAAGLGLPSCTIGKTYRFEPVPTDVEVGPGGMLYVSSLPGGPEDPSLGARGRVLKINPATGATTVIGRGFVTATNVAVTPSGKVYVAELFANQISTIKNGWAQPVVEVPTPAAVEYANGRIYASINVFNPDGSRNGSIVTITQ